MELSIIIQLASPRAFDKHSWNYFQPFLLYTRIPQVLDARYIKFDRAFEIKLINENVKYMTASI